METLNPETYRGRSVEPGVAGVPAPGPGVGPLVLLGAPDRSCPPALAVWRHLVRDQRMKQLRNRAPLVVLRGWSPLVVMDGVRQALHHVPGIPAQAG